MGGGRGGGEVVDEENGYGSLCDRSGGRLTRGKRAHKDRAAGAEERTQCRELGFEMVGL